MLPAGSLIQLGSLSAIGTSPIPVNIMDSLNFWVNLSGTGAVSATVDIVASVDGNPANEVSILSTLITLSGSNTTVQFTEKVVLGGYYRFKVTAISGSGAAVAVTGRV